MRSEKKKLTKKMVQKNRMQKTLLVQKENQIGEDEEEKKRRPKAIY